MVESSDDIGAHARAQHPPPQGPPQHLRELEDVRTPGEPEDVLGVVGVRACHDADLLRDLPHREGDVRTGQVVIGHDDQGGLIGPKAPIRLGVVERAEHDPIVLIGNLQGAWKLRDEEAALIAVFAQGASRAPRRWDRSS
ncbi:MAG: hypothetical protein MZV64_70505 [Ignavibacteriales bacterium]|nr:hypothetical protein [Ignavibacteriales bacterium]